LAIAAAATASTVAKHGQHIGATGRYISLQSHALYISTPAASHHCDEDASAGVQLDLTPLKLEACHVILQSLLDLWPGKQDVQLGMSQAA
jgi:hypothetical protein